MVDRRGPLLAGLVLLLMTPACSIDPDVAVTGNADGWVQVDGGALVPGVVAVPPSQWSRCGLLAAAHCAALARCQPHLFEIDYDDEALCVGREQLRCSLMVSAPGSGGFAQGTAECAAIISQAACDDVGIAGPAGCAFVSGDMQDGADCAFDNQCASKRCASKTGGCGRCLPAVVAPINCAPAGAEGSFCGYGKVCAAGSCIAQGGAGDSCAGSNAGCHHALGLVCHNVEKVCVAAPMAIAGANCNMTGISTDVIRECRDSRCMNQNDFGAGHCVAYAADGAACTDWDGPPCRPPAACTEGVCVLPSGSCGGN